VGDTLQRSLRVLPNDLDINGHMNNGRYMTVTDLLLIEYFVRTGFVKALLRNRWRPMSGGTIISFRRGLAPFQTYTLRYRIDACDTHWNYMRFEFMDLKQRIVAVGYMKGAAVGKDGLVPNSQSYAALGLPLPTAQLPLAVRDWLAAEGALMQAAW
jgi:acyl-CoA thioesterase FadM